MNFGVIATGNHCDFNALRAAPRSLHEVGNPPSFRVIARSEATWQSPGTIHRNAVQKQTWHRNTFSNAKGAQKGGGDFVSFVNCLKCDFQVQYV